LLFLRGVATCKYKSQASWQAKNLSQLEQRMKDANYVKQHADSAREIQ